MLRHIERTEPTVGAYLHVCADEALRAAERSDERRAAGEARGILDGIPFAVKDNI